MELPQNVADAIKANLPAALGDELRAQLNKLEKLEKQYEYQSIDLANAKQQVAINGNLLTKAEGLNKREADLTTREAALVKLEQACEVRFAVQEAVAKHVAERVRDLKDVTLAVFANNRFKHTETESLNTLKVVQGSNGSGSYTMPHTDTTVKTTEGDR